MNKKFRLFASLTLGIMVASCQNGLEEVLDPSAVQDELATTRAEIETPIDEEIIEEYATGPAIDGPSIIGGSGSFTYSVIHPTGTTTTWSYPSNLFNVSYQDNDNLIVTLKNTNVDADAIIVARYYNSDGSLHSTYIKYVGINGPYKNTSSVVVVRSSDGAEAYPSTALRLEPNTWYYAFFSCPVTVSVTDWVFSNAENISFSGYQCHFKTDSQGWSFLQVKGKMSAFNVEKTLLDVTLFGQ